MRKVILSLILVFSFVLVGCNQPTGGGGGGGGTGAQCTHSWGNWTIVTPATETTSGSRTRTCNLCGQVQTQTIPPTGGGVTDPFAGTWLGRVYPLSSNVSVPSIIVAANGSWSEAVVGGEIFLRGTYTYSGNQVTATFTDLNPGQMGGPNQWFTWDELPQLWRLWATGGVERATFTITGNTFQSDQVTYTRQ